MLQRTVPMIFCVSIVSFPFSPQPKVPGLYSTLHTRSTLDQWATLVLVQFQSLLPTILIVISHITTVVSCWISTPQSSRHVPLFPIHANRSILRSAESEPWRSNGLSNICRTVSIIGLSVLGWQARIELSRTAKPKSELNNATIKPSATRPHHPSAASFIAFF